MAFMAAGRISSNVAMSALSTQSASSSRATTATSPLRIRRYQCSVRSPSAMSKRTVPVWPTSVGCCCSESLSKNVGGFGHGHRSSRVWSRVLYSPLFQRLMPPSMT